MDNIVRELRAVAKNHEGKRYNTFEINIGDLATDCANEIERLQAEIAALREANRWISVAERLPEESGRYLVQVNRIASECLGGNSNFMRIKMFTNGEWAYGTHSPAWVNGELKDCVTHWRPLPTVPEKGE